MQIWWHCVSLLYIAQVCFSGHTSLFRASRKTTNRGMYNMQWNYDSHFWYNWHLLFIQLYSDKCPKTCSNFLELCSGTKVENEKMNTAKELSYKQSIFHRIVPNGWIQGGGVVDLMQVYSKMHIHYSGEIRHLMVACQQVSTGKNSCLLPHTFKLF